MFMKNFRWWLMEKLGANVSTVISVGVHTTPGSAQRTVSITAREGSREIAFRLSSPGARLIAKQITDWADECDKFNAEAKTEKHVMAWKAIIDVATREKPTEEPAPAQ